MISLPPSSPPVEKRSAILPGELPVVLGPLQALQLLQHLAPALRLLGLLAGDVAADEVLGLLDVLLLPLVLDARPLEARVALDHVLVVARTGSATNLPSSSSTISRQVALDEGAVVRHQHEGARVLGQVRLQPLDGREVQVVGRLVEQQQIGLAHQHLGQLQPPALAARQRAHRRGRGRPRRSPTSAVSRRTRDSSS